MTEQVNWTELKNHNNILFMEQSWPHIYFIIGISFKLSHPLELFQIQTTFSPHHDLQSYSSFTGIHKAPKI